MNLELSGREAHYLRAALYTQLVLIGEEYGHLAALPAAVPGAHKQLLDATRLCDELLGRLRVPVFYPTHQGVGDRDQGVGISNGERPGDET